MALDDRLRGELRKAVQKARELLTDNLKDVLEGSFGIDRSGRFRRPEDMELLKEDPRARETRDLLERVLPQPTSGKAGQEGFAKAFDALLRSLAFTHMNRLVAFKLMEHPSRKLTPKGDAVGRGMDSRGFKFYLAAHPKDEALWSGGRQEEAYQNFLLWLCGEWNREIGVLFDPDDLASRVFPRWNQALKPVLDLINAPELAEVWQEEEAAGWVYQYWTPKELRDQARKASQAPRNSYEMAFRNQFYTPDYVVRFLAENTLGRLWLEMHPDTSLREKCEYLVIRPDEKLETRAKKDPREIRVIDPACGSGHFLLYAFELLDVIYREAYDDAELGSALRKDFPDREVFEARIPALILEHNLHGIDIDRRATQIASLALFLKAKSRSKDVKIEKGNIVVAEPMPGDRALFEDFKRRKLDNGKGALARMLDGFWKHLELAGEAGSLLKAEEAVGRLVEDEHRKWREARVPSFTPLSLFGEPAAPGQPSLDYSDVTGEKFWAGAEDEIRRLLREYAQEAAGAEGAHRRMFARDSEEGLRFVDVLAQRYDVALMNPPFGAAASRSKPYIETVYSRTKNDVYAAFVERWLGRLAPRGFLGAITSRTGFFLSSFQKWREEVLLDEARPTVFADLGYGVLDAAMVETAAYVLEAAS
jgi:hypothetical protein